MSQIIFFLGFSYVAGLWLIKFSLLAFYIMVFSRYQKYLKSLIVAGRKSKFSFELLQSTWLSVSLDVICIALSNFSQHLELNFCIANQSIHSGTPFLPVLDQSELKLIQQDKIATMATS